MAQKKIIVIDGSSYFFRAYYAIQRLSTSKGFPTNAIFGFINMLMKTLEVEKPERLAIAFDTAKPSFRKELYKEYKANRERPPEDLIVQIPEILKVVDCFGVRRLELEGFEADDIIGTIVRKAREDKIEVDIITGDKDLMQLVDERTTIYDSMRDKRYDTAGVKEKFGVEPHQVIDYLALMGDASDNIPGVTGIGEKTAAELINAYGSLDGIYENLEKIKQEKRRETLKSEKEIAYLSKQLATVDCNVPLDFNWDEMEYKGVHKAELKAFCERMEFRGLIKRLQLEEVSSEPGSVEAGSVSTPPPVQKRNYTTIRTVPELRKLVSEIEKAPVLSLDTETTSLTIHKAKLVGISLCISGGDAFYLPIGHTPLGDKENLVEAQLPVEESREILRSVLENPKIKKIGQNLKYDVQILRHWGIQVRGVAGDTLLASYLVDPDKSHSLDALADRYLGHTTIKYSDVTGKGKSQISFSEVEIDKATEYSCEDADIAFQLHEILVPQLKERELTRLYEDLEVPIVDILSDMEYGGVLVDDKSLLKMSEDLTNESGEVENKIYQIAGETFNIASPKQLSTILFEKLKLPVIRKTKTGISTDEAVLQQLRSKHEICDWILKYRELAKLRSTYVDGLLAEMDPVTKRVHTSYNQTVAATGRLSSSNPNLQNIPTGENKYDIRSAFIAPAGHELMSADYSQIELRLLADMSGDKELLRAFSNDEDIHSYTGKLIFKKDTISSDERRIAKTINFGVVYGQTPFGLSQTLKISPGEAKAFIEAYFERYSEVKKFYVELLSEAKSRGYVMTKLGRRRYLPDLNSQNRMMREMAERAAINAPLQGSAADLIKLAMIRVFHRLQKEQLTSRMILQVHDELVFEVANDEKEVMRRLVCEEMEGAMKLKIPLKVDLGWGKNWRESKQ